MDVEGLAEQRSAHCRALDVPAGPACAIGACPFRICRLTILGRLPEHEVQRVLLVAEHGHALAGAQIVERLARELAVAREAPDGEVHITTGGPVGQPLGFEGLDQTQHLRHIVGGPRFVVGQRQAQSGKVAMHRRDHLVGECADRDSTFEGAADDLVFDVGDVADIGDLQATGAQPTVDHVEGQHHPRMTQMAQVVDGDAADVHPHLACTQRHEDLQPARQSVVDSKTHRDRQCAAGTRWCARLVARHAGASIE